MNKIKPLAHSDVVKIAAGEVIGRPANAIKEMVENSIDALATQIGVTIVGSGRHSIRISDNGCGMSPDDAANSIGLHWTSKIENFEDLSTCQTLGFRGEALASIAAVGELEIQTTLAGAASGFKICFKDQRVVSSQETAPVPGTVIQVTNLFGSLPARRKFLASDVTEYNSIVQALQALALGRPDIGISLESDGRQVFNWPAAQGPVERAAQIFGPELAEQLILAQSPLLEAWVGRPTLSKHNKNFLYTFANSRYFKDSRLAGALVSAYSRSLGQGRYPVAFVYLRVAPESLDVNVHPRKEEVKFQNHDSIAGQLYNAVNRALSQDLANAGPVNIEICPAGPEETEQSGQSLVDVFQPAQVAWDFVSTSTADEQKACAFDQGLFVQPNEEVISVEPWSSIVQQSFIEKRANGYLGHLFKTFILFQEEASLLIVDQHAAAERVLYEKHLGQRLPAVRLLAPELMSATPQDRAFVEQYRQALLFFGMDVDVFGPLQLCIRATPGKVSAVAAREILEKILQDQACQEGAKGLDFAERIGRELFAEICCKSAVKAGQELSQIEAEALVQDLLATKESFQCIHGRPTFWRLEKHEIAKKFKRPSKVF